MFSDATRILIQAIDTRGVRRLVCITGIGDGDSRGHGGFLYDKIIFPWITKETYVDKTDKRPLFAEAPWIGTSCAGRPSLTVRCAGIFGL